MMTNSAHSKNHDNLRQYVRLSSVFPVHFSLVHLQDDVIGLGSLKGYTRNVSEGGMCLETTALSEATITYLTKSNVLLEVRFQILPNKPPIKAIVEVAWFRKIEGDDSCLYLIGLKFRSVIASEINQVIRHAKSFVVLSRLAIIGCLILFVILLIIGTAQHKNAVARDKLRYNLEQLK